MRCLSWPEAGPRRPLLRPQPGRHDYSQLPLGKRLDAVHRLELGPFQRNGIQIVTPTGGVLDLRTMMGELYVTMQALHELERSRTIEHGHLEPRA